MRFWRRCSHDHDALVCREFVELVTDYLAGALPEHESVRFEAHLAECDSCAGYLQDMRRIVDTFTKCRNLHPIRPYAVLASRRSRFLTVRLASRVKMSFPTSLNSVPKILPRGLCVNSWIQIISTLLPLSAGVARSCQLLLAG